jgi:tetratricopeptide (TPR) repeat protein
VRDERDGRTWALKLLLPLADPQAAARLRREFRALARLTHPNVLQVREWGLHGRRPWFTMELVQGQNLGELVATWEDLEPEDRFQRAQSVLVQVARALAYVHERGLVHRDVSPGNIMIATDGTVKLTDFGLVTDSMNSNLTHAGEVLGTVAFTAPEQLTGEEVDARTDQYGLGAVLYLMLTGRKPFQAHTFQGYVDQQLHKTPRRPSEIDPLVPEQLDRVCMRLLEKSPAQRFASTSHLLNVLGDLPDLGQEEQWPPHMVGRSVVKGWVRGAIDELLAGNRGGALMATGAAGQGKTRVLDFAQQEGRRNGLRVVRGRCRSHDRPFGAFVGIYQSLKGKEPAPALVAAFEGTDDAHRIERYPVFAAFRELVAQNTPCIVLIDDLEKADAATRELLDYLVRNTLELAELPVAWVLTYAAAEDAEPALLRGLDVVDHQHLGRLQSSDVEELVLSMLADTRASAALARRLCDETEGSPAFLADMLRGLVDEGVIKRNGARWSLELPPEELGRSSLPLPPNLRASLAERLQPLSPDALEIARTVALTRRGIALEPLIEAVDLPEDRIMQALDELVDADILEERRRDSVDHVELTHARLHDLLVESLPEVERRERHQRLGELLERRHRSERNAVVEDLAFHFERANVAPKAYAYLFQTARKNLRRSLHEEALHFLDRTLRLAPLARPYLLLEEADRRQCEVYLAQASSLLHVGRPEDAEEAARRASALADAISDHVLQARVATLRGHMLRTRGVQDEAERCFRSALDHAHKADVRALRPVPLYHLGAVLWSRGQLDAARACWEEVRELGRELGNERAEGRAYNGLGILEFCNGRPAEARRLLERSAEIFERLGMLEVLAVTRVNLIELYLSSGLLRRAFDLAERTHGQAREVGHQHGISMGLGWRARLLLTLGRPEDARRNALEALRIATDLGAIDELIVSLTTLVQVMLDLEMAAQARPRADHLLELLASADYEGVTPLARALLAQIHVASHEPDLARGLLSELGPRPIFPHTQIRIDLEVAAAWRLLDEPEIATQHAQSALDTATRCHFDFYALAAHHQLAQTVPEGAERERHARKARSVARSLSASLDRNDGASFLARGWGVPR